MRKRSPGRKLPLDTIKEALRDGRVWVKVGIVTKFEGETSHYELDGEDLLVDVELMPDRQPLLCRLGVTAGGAGIGLWWIPPEGAEVLVAVPDGDVQADPVIVACLSAQSVPDGVNESTVILAVPSGATLKIHDGDAGDAVPLATKADVDAVQAALDGHVHTYLSTIQCPTGTLTTTPLLTTSNPVVPAPDGTSVLLAK